MASDEAGSNLRPQIYQDGKRGLMNKDSKVEEPAIREVLARVEQRFLSLYHVKTPRGGELCQKDRWKLLILKCQIPKLS